MYKKNLISRYPVDNDMLSCSLLLYDGYNAGITYIYARGRVVVSPHGLNQDLWSKNLVEREEKKWAATSQTQSLFLSSWGDVRSQLLGTTHHRTSQRARFRRVFEARSHKHRRALKGRKQTSVQNGEKKKLAVSYLSSKFTLSIGLARVLGTLVCFFQRIRPWRLLGKWRIRASDCFERWPITFYNESFG